MTQSRINKLRARFTSFTESGNVNDPVLLADLVDYKNHEIGRSFRETSVQSELTHKKLMEELESMINTLKPNEESEVQKKRLP